MTSSVEPAAGASGLPVSLGTGSWASIIKLAISRGGHCDFRGALGAGATFTGEGDDRHLGIDMGGYSWEQGKESLMLYWWDQSRSETRGTVGTQLRPHTTYTLTIEAGTAMPCTGEVPPLLARRFEAQYRTGADTLPPGLLSQRVTGTATTSIELETVLLEPATYELVGEGGGHRFERSGEDSGPVHTVRLTGLEPGTTYRFETRWTDSSGNTATYDFAGKTEDPPPTTTTTTSTATTTTSSTTTTSTTMPDTGDPATSTTPALPDADGAGYPVRREVAPPEADEVADPRVAHPVSRPTGERMAGLREPVTVTLPAGEGFPPASILVESDAVEAGSVIDLEARGFAPGAPLTVALHSTPRLLGRLTTDESGRYVGSVLVPDDVDSGDHHLVVDGQGPGGDPITARIPVVVLPRPSNTALVVAAEPGNSGSGPFPGILLAASVGAGALWTAYRRRRRPGPGALDPTRTGDL